jgi:hypothetical protein
MEKKERFNKAFAYLKFKGIISKQKDLADLMGSSEATVSLALKGDPAALTARFLRRFNTAADNVFSLDWLLTGEGEMLAPQPMAGSVSVSPDLLERLYAELHSLRQEVADLRQEVAALRPVADHFIDVNKMITDNGVNNYNYAPSLSMVADDNN